MFMYITEVCSITGTRKTRRRQEEERDAFKFVHFGRYRLRIGLVDSRQLTVFPNDHYTRSPLYRPIHTQMGSRKTISSMISPHTALFHTPQLYG